MKVGVITIYDAFNYGSYLQAYAIQKILQKCGHQVSILNCSKSKYKNIKRIISKRPSRIKLNINKLIVYSRAWKELNIIPYNDQELDAAIIGSDEVWNIKNSSFEHWPQYFGYNLNAKKIIAYAPSCGFAKMEDILADEKCLQGIKQLDEIFARDLNTKLIAEKIRSKECKMVVDPTLLYLDNWQNEIKPYLNMPCDYILYYSYNPKPLMLDYIKRFAKEKNLKIVVAGFKYDWCDKSLIVEPKQFLNLVKKAKYVVTTTFHGSIFSVIFKKKFIGFQPNKNPKVHDFLLSIGLEKRVYTAGMEYSLFRSIIERQVDYEKIHEKIKKQAISSISLLKEELETII